MTRHSTSHPTPKSSHLAIFTDLDGTLLDERYSWEPAADCLAELRRRGVPVILCTSKTRLETEEYHRQMGLADPFVVENGGAIIIPQGYFQLLPPEAREEGDVHVIESDIPHSHLLAALDQIKRRVVPQALGFSDLSPEWLAEIAGLSRQQAILAKSRQYDEPFLAPQGEFPIEEVKKIIQDMGLKYSRGTRFHHISGPHDKGTAVQRLMKLFRGDDPGLFSVGLGDGPIDIPFLEQMDLPIVVQNKAGRYHSAFRSAAYLKSPGIGPWGWYMAVGRLLAGSVQNAQTLKPSRGEE
jgi:mannosyl-3-phosphoglycerate phosphatase